MAFHVHIFSLTDAKRHVSDVFRRYQVSPRAAGKGRNIGRHHNEASLPGASALLRRGIRGYHSDAEITLAWSRIKELTIHDIMDEKGPPLKSMPQQSFNQVQVIR